MAETPPERPAPDTGATALRARLNRGPRQSTPKVTLPKSARSGACVAVRAALCHPMETGRRAGDDGQIVPRAIIHSFSCLFNGETVIDVRFEPGVSPDPELVFEAHIDGAAGSVGLFDFAWQDDEGHRFSARVPIDIL
ncbi:sulfur oxidation protein SoxZ [Aquimixticola soesokkakensis]|uniref:Sulfur oxidation protein SoxZ n=1 Tax=Aquimixticola soesokkakensis TaxID=1519096 RepID=A0A1Y5TK70_9RHOB|nr:thiosulfate oxidation carrier complex protein SoxZ [Aquimixticola soesokkakensis]SLN66240.1 sulfur oxidation protein SoxZ [Aquimixticola soesokkakensis]